MSRPHRAHVRSTDAVAQFDQRPAVDARMHARQFVHRLLHEARERPQWSDARTVHLALHAGAIAPRALAELLVALGSRRRVSGASRQLELIAELLDARPHLVFIDDVHHLPSLEVGEALGFLSRHVQNSRLFVASRREIPLSRDARPPVITTLGPLDDRAAGDLIAALGDHASRDPGELSPIVRAAHGSPFFIRRAFFRGVDCGDTFDFADLPADARRTLLMASVARFRPPIAAVPAAALRALAERFLVDVEDERLVVHDLVREALLSAAAPDELAAAHADAAAFCVDQLRETPLAAVDAVSHLLLAERFERAFEVVERSYSLLRAGGAEHLLLDALRRLREALPARQARIDLLVAQTLARASLFDEAEQVLSHIPEELDEADRSQRAALLGEIALHRGDSAAAMDAFERAAALAPDSDARFQVRLRLTTAATLALDGTRGRAILDAALAEHPEPTARQRARHDLALTLSWVFDEQFERAAEIARAARVSLPPGHPDLASRLSMLETLAAIESEDLEHAREAARHIDSAPRPPIARQGTRRPFARVRHRRGDRARARAPRRGARLGG